MLTFYKKVYYRLVHWPNKDYMSAYDVVVSIVLCVYSVLASVHCICTFRAPILTRCIFKGLILCVEHDACTKDQSI